MRRITFAIFVLASFCAAQQREQPPAPGKPKPFTVPAKQTTTLKNGTRVTLVPYGNLPKVTVSAYVLAGNVNEARDQVWLADLLGEMMKEGAGSRNSEQLAQEAARMGGQVSVGVSGEQTTVSIDALSEFAADAVKLIADVVQRPLLPESELARLRKDMQRRLVVQLSRPQAIADQAFYKQIYGDHPYGRIYPTEEMVGAYTIEDVRNFYKSNFGAARTHVYVAGKFDAGVLKAVTAAFENWSRGPDPAPNPAKTEPKKSLTLIDRPGAPQSTLRIGLPVPHPKHEDYLPLALTNTMLGGSFSSRITKNIREARGYTYSPFSMIVSHYRDAFWAEYADITTDVTGPALQEIVQEINGIRREPPPAGELKGIQNYMNGTFVLRNSSRQGIIGQLAFVNLHELGDDWLSTYVQRVQGVTAADVQRIGEKYLDPEKMTVVIVGDKTKVEPQLAKTAP